MIVMKFGGSSVATAARIKHVASIVQSALARRPVVVVSALGDTTNQLVQVLHEARRGFTYSAWKIQKELKEYHFGITEEILSSHELNEIDQYLRSTFRDLHVQMLEVAEEGREVTPELTDQVLSLGEQLSSRILAAALKQAGVDTVHFDARDLILTDENFTQAKPRYWETYAKIRWSIPQVVLSRVPVLGGFIGATEDGATTTLGRGGSDLTASIVGAAINAEEIQIWKDVDGMLTCDPKLKKGGYRLRTLSYREAAELAQAGAKILHPDTIAPARRLRIPVVLRNTFKPQMEGTKITARGENSTNVVKSIACKLDVTLLEIRSPHAGISVAEGAHDLITACKRHKVTANLLGMSDETIYVALDGREDHSQLSFSLEQCLEFRVRGHQAVLTVVGDGLDCNSDTRLRLSRILADAPVVMLPQHGNSCSISVVVPARDLLTYVEMLHREFFNHVDSNVFAPLTVQEPVIDRLDRVKSASMVDRDFEVRKAARLALAK
jgi:aspartate kinase